MPLAKGTGIAHFPAVQTPFPQLHRDDAVTLYLTIDFRL
jgi:hypothetical protein